MALNTFGGINLKRLIYLVVFLLLIGVIIPITGLADGSMMLNLEIVFQKKSCIYHQKKVISGFKDGSFKPNDVVTRAQAAIMIGRALDLDGTQRSTKFKDVPSSSVASGYIASAVEKGIISGFKDGSYKPGQPVTRGQMAIFLNRAFHLKMVLKTHLAMFALVWQHTKQYLTLH